MQIILFEPEIPPNTGNVARLCAGLGLTLNLVEPLGFKIDDKHLKRAGLDYWPSVDLRIWPSWGKFKAGWSGGRLIGASARGGVFYADQRFKADDGLVFGPETRGLPPEILAELFSTVNVPIRPCVRSFNLATAVGLIAGEALRQTDLFPR